MLLFILKWGLFYSCLLSLLGEFISTLLESFLWRALYLNSLYYLTFLLTSLNFSLILWRAFIIFWTFYIACWITDSSFFYFYLLDFRISGFMTYYVQCLYFFIDCFRLIISVLIFGFLSTHGNSDLISFYCILSFLRLTLTYVKKFEGWALWYFFPCANCYLKIYFDWLTGLNCEYLEEWGEFLLSKNYNIALLSSFDFSKLFKDYFLSFLAISLTLFFHCLSIFL